MAAGGQITGYIEQMQNTATALGKVSDDITKTVQTPPLPPDVGANAGYSGQVGGMTQAPVDFPEADQFLKDFQALQERVVGDIQNYGHVVGIVGSGTKTIAGEYASASDATKINADQVNNALQVVPTPQG